MAARKRKAKRKAARAKRQPHKNEPRRVNVPKIGRPTKFKPEFTEQAKKLCELGATDADVADFFRVSDRTFYRWQAANPEFCQALKAGKERADDRVERALFHKAVGYAHDAVKIFLPKDAEEPVYVPFREHFPPDTTAAIFWLKNRRPDVWRDRQHLEHTGQDGKPIETKDVSDFSDLDVARRIAFLLTKATKKEA